MWTIGSAGASDDETVASILWTEPVSHKFLSVNLLAVDF